MFRHTLKIGMLPKPHIRANSRNMSVLSTIANGYFDGVELTWFTIAPPWVLLKGYFGAKDAYNRRIKVTDDKKQIRKHMINYGLNGSIDGLIHSAIFATFWPISIPITGYLVPRLVYEKYMNNKI